MKKLVTVFAFVFAFSLVGLVACGKGNNEKKSKYLAYEIDNTGTITRYYANENNSENIVIPATYDIDAEGRIIKGSSYEIKAIGDYCFANNTKTKRVVIPQTITTIGNNAFYNCSQLNSVNVGRNISKIGNDAFGNCSSLTTIAKTGDTGIIIEKNDNLSSFEIHESVSKIDDGAFAGWSQLSSIMIGENVTYIGDNAFSGCENLAKVVIDSSLTYLGENAFSDCEKLTILTSAESDYGICFKKAQSLENFTVPLSVIGIYGNFFYGWKELKNVTIHESVTPIGSIFYDNTKLTSITCAIPCVLSLFSDNAEQSESTKMYAVELAYRFQRTYYYIPVSLKEVHLLGEIGDYCLYGMNSLLYVYIESDVSSFGTGAFGGCDGLTEVYFSTNSNWRYENNSSTPDSGVISVSVMNSPFELAYRLKIHGQYRWYKDTHN